jgi:hypothetical protein
MKYALKTGGKTLNGVAVQSVGEALESLRSANDDERLIVENVLEAAKRKTSPLHPQFTWDNGKAAEEYRKQEARQLIRIVVEVDEAGESLPAFVSVVMGEGQERTQYYQRLQVCSQDERASAVRELVHQLKAIEGTVLAIKRTTSSTISRAKKAAIRTVASAVQTAQQAAARI